MSAQRRAESLLSAEKRTLEMIANGVDLADILDDLCRAIDAHVPGVISTILLIDADGTRLRLGAGPRFPIALKPAINQWPVGFGKGSCGTAAFLKQRVIISDVATDPKWPDEYRAVAMSHGLRASWSEPLISKEGAVLGTFAMYYAEPRIPDASDLELIESAGSIALIAIQMERSQAALRESEERFRLVANTAPVLIWVAGVDKLCTYFNQSWLQFTGRPLEAELGNGWTEDVHADDLERCLEIFTQSFDKREPFQMEYRLRRHDGEYRWILDSGVLRFAPGGSFVGYIGSCIDVTERKLAEQTVSALSQKLITAQEEERSWIARELHDDINQRIALLAVNLETLRRDLPASVAEVRKSVAEASKQAQDIGSDVQALSHRLHSSKLELLGLERAAASFCAELSHQQEVEIDFCSENIPKELPTEICICLFRILQEALQNARKHSGARHFQVSLSGRLDGIYLSVRDSGIGFNPNEAMRGRGLGLTSMKERLKLVNGELSIDSQPQRGTTILVRVPLSSRMGARGAAG